MSLYFYNLFIISQYVIKSISRLYLYTFIYCNSYFWQLSITALHLSLLIIPVLTYDFSSRIYIDNNKCIYIVVVLFYDTYN